jgi:hypothetical protein
MPPRLADTVRGHTQHSPCSEMLAPPHTQSVRISPQHRQCSCDRGHSGLILAVASRRSQRKDRRG